MINIFVITTDLIGIAEIIFAVMEKEKLRLVMDVVGNMIEIFMNLFKKKHVNRCLLSEPNTVKDLISAGVAVQKWFSVNLPPKESGEYMCYFKYEPENPDVISQNTYYGSGRWMYESDRVTHWTYLHQQPKGE